MLFEFFEFEFFRLHEAFEKDPDRRDKLAEGIIVELCPIFFVFLLVIQFI